MKRRVTGVGGLGGWCGGGKGQGLFPGSCGEADEKQRDFLGEESSAGQWGGGVCGGGGQ